MSASPTTGWRSSTPTTGATGRCATDARTERTAPRSPGSPTSRLLAVAVDGDDEALVRVDLDGTVSRASEVRPAGSLSLVTQP